MLCWEDDVPVHPECPTGDGCADHPDADAGHDGRLHCGHPVDCFDQLSAGDGAVDDCADRQFRRSDRGNWIGHEAVLQHEPKKGPQNCFCAVRLFRGTALRIRHLRHFREIDGHQQFLGLLHRRDSFRSHARPGECQFLSDTGADFGALTAGAKEKNIEIKKTVTDSLRGYPL